MIVDYGEKLVLHGEVGVGKSTLLSCISGIESYYQGNIEIDKNSEQKSAILSIPQDVLILDETLEENCLFGKKPNQEYFELIEKFDLSHLEICDKISSETISGGERKRIGFVRFLMNRRPINLLDEVLTEVDGYVLDKMIECIKKLDETVIFVSHNPKVIESFNSKKIDKVASV